MRVTGPHYILTGEVVKLAAAEPGHDARRNSQGTQHHGHGTGEILAVAFLSLEEKIRQRILRQSSGQFQGVSEVGLEILFESDGFVVIAGSVRGDVAGQLRDTGIER